MSPEALRRVVLDPRGLQDEHRKAIEAIGETQEAVRVGNGARRLRDDIRPLIANNEDVWTGSRRGRRAAAEVLAGLAPRLATPELRGSVAALAEVLSKGPEVGEELLGSWEQDAREAQEQTEALAAAWEYGAETAAAIRVNELVEAEGDRAGWRERVNERLRQDAGERSPFPPELKVALADAAWLGEAELREAEQHGPAASTQVAQRLMRGEDAAALRAAGLCCGDLRDTAARLRAWAGQLHTAPARRRVEAGAVLIAEAADGLAALEGTEANA